MGRAELGDQRAGVDKLISMGFADPKRIGIFGWSYGGFMTIYSLLHAPEVFKRASPARPLPIFATTTPSIRNATWACRARTRLGMTRVRTC